MRILIVEDERIQAFTLKLHLMELGFDDVVLFDPSKDNLTYLHNESFDLVFCDISMPHVDGITLISKYLSHSRIKGIVVMSAVDDAVLNLTRGMSNLMQFDYVDVLKKPFNKPQLSQLIERYSSRITTQRLETTCLAMSKEELADALPSGLFFPLFQPQFDFRTGNLVGVEALARYEDQQGNVHSPVLFLETIKHNGLMMELYRSILDKATLAIGSLDDKLKLSVNVTQQLLVDDLSDVTIAICAQNDFALNRLILEVTEQEAYDPHPLALANLARLRLNGVQLSIDDFGTGYASLEQLIDLPFTELKVDRLFISNVRDSYKHQQLTKMSLNLAHSLDMTCVAEGVEDLATWEYLKSIGFDVCQGYYTGKPMNISQMQELIQEQQLSLYLDTDSETVASYPADILLVDGELSRAKALSSLIKKECSNMNVYIANDLEATHCALRDLAIDSVIVDEDMVGAINNELYQKILPKLAKLPVFELSTEGKKGLAVTSVGHIVKSDSLTTIAKRFVSALKTRAQFEQKRTKLSSRESMVARMLAQGFTSKHIAFELGISQKTVSTYKARIFDKLNVTTMVDFVVKMKENS